MGIMNSPALADIGTGIAFRPDANCILYFPGQDDPQSAVLRDRSGNDNNGAILGATWERLAGGFWALHFDGSDDYVNIASPSASMQNLQAWTYECWMYSDINNSIDKLMSNSKKVIGLYTSGQIRSWAVASGGTAESHTNTGVIAAATWYHIAMRYDHAGDKKVDILVNGVELVYARQDTASGTLTADAGDKFVIGIDIGLASNTFDGFLPLNRVHKVALSTAVLKGHYDQERHLFGA